MLGFKFVRVIGDSMEPALKNNNILILKTRFRKSSLKKNDIVAFKSPLNGTMILIKRIVATPGEFIQIYSNNEIRINKSPDFHQLDTSWIEFEWDLLDDQYVVLGDNTSHSQDSKTFGPITFDSITGKVIRKL